MTITNIIPIKKYISNHNLSASILYGGGRRLIPTIATVAIAAIAPDVIDVGLPRRGRIAVSYRYRPFLAH